MSTKKYLSYERLQEYDNLIKAYADNAAAAVKNYLLNGAGDAYDTLKELGDLINENVDAIDALETVAISKQDKLIGTEGQIVTFNAEGNVIVQDAPQIATSDDALDLLCSMGYIEPASSTTGAIYTDGNNKLFVL